MKNLFLVCVLSILSCSIFAQSRSEEISKQIQKYSQQESELRRLAGVYYEDRENDESFVLEKLEGIKEELDNIKAAKAKLQSEMTQVATASPSVSEGVPEKTKEPKVSAWKTWVGTPLFILVMVIAFTGAYQQYRSRPSAASLGRIVVENPDIVLPEPGRALMPQILATHPEVFQDPPAAPQTPQTPRRSPRAPRRRQTNASTPPGYTIAREVQRLQGLRNPIRSGNLDGSIDFDA